MKLNFIKKWFELKKKEKKDRRERFLCLPKDEFEVKLKKVSRGLFYSQIIVFLALFALAVASALGIERNVPNPIETIGDLLGFMGYIGIFFMILIIGLWLDSLFIAKRIELAFLEVEYRLRRLERVLGLRDNECLKYEVERK